MEAIILGTELTEINEVEKVIKDCTSYPVLLRQWSCFGRKLEVGEENILEIQDKVNSGTMQRSDIVVTLLQSWKAKYGTKATFSELCSALTETGAKDVAEYLASKFVPEVCGPESPTYSGASDSPVFVLEDEAIIYPLQLTETVSQVHIDLIKKQLFLPAYEKYYIQRTLSQMSKLDEKVFTDVATQDHKFYVSGTEEMEKVTGVIGIGGNRLISRVKDNLEDGNINYANHVHNIEYVDECFHWIGSTNGYAVLKRFFDDEHPNSSRVIEEEELVNRITTCLTTRAICISDSPGMGKSCLILNLAKSIQERCPKTIVLFIIFEELLKSIGTCQNGQMSRNFVIDVLAFHACKEQDKCPLLKLMLDSRKHQFVVFFDGFDELLPDQRKLAKNFIKAVSEMENLTICVTTRPHLQVEMENLLHTKAFRILPLTKSNQVQFLTDEWCRKHDAENSTYLTRYAESCLSVLDDKMTKGDSDIAGVPLRCAMLAEAYGDAAKTVLTKKTDVGAEVNITSVFIMFKSLVQKRFERIPKRPYMSSCDGNVPDKRKLWISVHYFQAILLLFRDCVEKLKPHFPLDSQSPPNYDDMYTIGLLENSPYIGTPRFVHRTIAEYLFAEFLVKKLGKCSSSIQFIFTYIFGIAGVNIEKNTNRNRHRAYHLRYPVIAYFFDRHLHAYLHIKNKRIDYKLISKFFTSMEAHEENICLALASTSSNNLEHSYDLAEQIIRQLDKRDSRKWSAFGKTHFKYLPHCIIQHAKNLDILKKVLRLTKSEFGADDLSFHVYHPIPRVDISKCGSYDAYIFPWVPGCTPLHVSIYYGCKDIYDYLKDIYGKEIQTMKYLMHVCVRNSVGNSESVLSNKVEIMNDLVKLNSYCLEEVFEDSGCTPLLQRQIHLEMLDTIVKLGGDVNAHSKLYGTVIHRVKMYNVTYSELLKWAIDNKFNQFGFTDHFGRTPILCAAQGFDMLDSNDLDVFHEHGANFKGNDINGYSVLFHAISGTNSSEILGKIIDFGANVNHTANNGDTVVHVLLKRLGKLSVTALSAKYVLTLLKILVSKGFSLVNQVNKDGLTPLHFAVRAISVDCEVLDYFKSIGADFNAVDNLEDSVLFHAISWNQSASCIKRILKYGGSAQHQNLGGRTALHVAAKYGNFAALKVLVEHEKLDVNALDNDNNAPLHRVFLRENAESIKVLELLLKKGARFDLKNMDGRVPLLEWIQEGKIDFSALVRKKDLLPLNPNLASSALSLLILKVDIVEKHFSQLKIDDRSSLSAFINILIKKGGKLRLEDGTLFEWGKLSFFTKKMIDSVICLTQELQYEISERITTIDRNVSSGTELTGFVRQYNIPVEVVFSSLLCCRDKEPFVNLCLLLSGRKKRVMKDKKCVIT